MPESFKSRLMRWKFNCFPAYRFSGARVSYIAGDLREMRIELPLNWRTRNYVNTLFGGSMYAAVDPIYMMMLIFNLGPDYIVWDKAANIHFKKPGKGTLYATFTLTETELSTIKAALTTQHSIDRHYTVELTDKSGLVHVLVDKTVYIRRK